MINIKNKLARYLYMHGCKRLAYKIAPAACGQVFGEMFVAQINSARDAIAAFGNAVKRNADAKATQKGVLT